MDPDKWAAADLAASSVFRDMTFLEAARQQSCVFGGGDMTRARCPDMIAGATDAI
jgi:hypothetical protein